MLLTSAMLSGGDAIPSSAYTSETCWTSSGYSGQDTSLNLARPISFIQYG